MAPRALLCCAAAGAPTGVLAATFDVRSFGAVGDGVTDDTPAFVAAIAKAEQAGGGTVLASRGAPRPAGSCALTKQLSAAGCTEGTSFGCFAGNKTMFIAHGCRGVFDCDGAAGVECNTMECKGRCYCPCVSTAPSQQTVYLIRPINLTSSMELYIQGGVTVAGVQDAAKWPVIPGAPSYGQGRNHGAFSPRYTSLIHGEHLSNVTVRGDGNTSVLDGQGAYWWHHPGGWSQTRGHLIEFMYSERIEIHDIAMVDAPFWNNHFFDCDGVHVRRVAITAPGDSPNTDGWDPDSSRNVVIEDSWYDAGDDCVAIKSGWDCFGVEYGKPSVNITVRNLTCHGHYAGIAIGSEMSGGVDNVTVTNVRFSDLNGAAHVKTGQSRGGYVTNVRFSDLTIAGDTQNGILIDAFYGAANPSCPKGWKPPAPPRMANYSFVRLNGRAATVSSNTFHFKGTSGSPIEGIYLEDVHFPSGKKSPDWLCDAVSGSARNGTVDPWPPCAAIVPSNARQ